MLEQRSSWVWQDPNTSNLQEAQRSCWLVDAKSSCTCIIFVLYCKAATLYHIGNHTCPVHKSPKKGRHKHQTYCMESTKHQAFQGTDDICLVCIPPANVLENRRKGGQCYIQYCAKVMQTIIDEYRDISAIFNEILP